MMSKIVVSSSFNDVYVAYIKEGKTDLTLINGKNSGSKIIPEIKKFFDRYKETIDDTEEIAVDIGPGSFTGIRVLIAAVLGLTFGKKIKIKTFYSTDIIINSLSVTGKVAVLRRARENAAYVMIYEGKNIISEPVMINGEELKNVIGNILLAGEESMYFIKKYGLENEYTDVVIKKEAFAEILEKSEEIKREDLKPLYLQKPIAVEMFEKNKKMRSL